MSRTGSRISSKRVAQTPTTTPGRPVTGYGGFWRAGEGLATGQALLDQAWHWGWIFVAALVITGRPG